MLPSSFWLYLSGLSFLSCLGVRLTGTSSDPWNVAHPEKTSDQIISALKRHKIIPEVVQRVSADIQVCEVSYNDTVVNFGNVINYTFIQEHEPTHVKWPYKEGVLYTLILTSPDAPGREEHNERELKMWLVGNIPENRIENGTSIADYAGMVPFYEEVVMDCINGNVNGLARNKRHPIKCWFTGLQHTYQMDQSDAGSCDASNKLWHCTCTI